MGDRPHFTVLAGPNGSGKSTAAFALLPRAIPFVNADEIAKALPGYPSRAVDLEASQIALERMDALAENHAAFAFETTLASRSLASRIGRLKGAGYLIRLLFLFSPSPDFSVQRVSARVRAGGHDVPESTIRRRYRAGLVNFRDLYRPLADRWIVYDNTAGDEPKVIASGSPMGVEIVRDPDIWARFEERLASDGL